MTKADSKITTFGLYLLILSVSPVIFMTNILDAFNTPKVWLFASLVAALTVHFVIEPKDGLLIKRKVQLTLLLLALLAGMFTTSFLSETTASRIFWGYPGRANGMIYYTSVLLALYTVIWTSPKNQNRKKSLFAIQVPLLFNALYCTLQFFNLDPIAWSNPYNRIIGVFGNPNFSAAALGVYAILLLALSMDQGNSFRVIFFANALWTSFLSWRTESIQGPLLIGFGICLIALMNIKQRFSSRSFLFSIALFSSLCVAAVISFFGFGPFGEKLQQYTLILRFEYWKIAIRSALENPIFGLGPDSYFEGFLQYRTPEFIAKYSVGLRADAAHSAPLNYLASFGFINFTLYLLLLVVITVISMRILFKFKHREDLKVYALAWNLFTLQSFFSLEQVGLGILQWLIGGVLLRSYVSQESDDELETTSKKSNKAVVGSTKKVFGFREFRGEISLVIFILSLFALSTPIRDELILKRVASLSGEYSENSKIVVGEMNRISEISKVEYKRAMYLADFFLRANDVGNAEKIINHVIQADPQAYDALEQLARIKHFRKQYFEEIDLRQRVFKINPNDFRNTLQIAEAYLNLGEKNNARKWASITKEISGITPESDSATSLMDSLKG